MAVWDWLIVVGYVLAVVAIGSFTGRSVGSVADFIVAGRGVGLSLNVAVLTSTEIAIITAMALAEMGYESGFSAMILGLCFCIGVSFIGATGFLVEGLRRLRVMTIPEFYGVRYHPKLRWFGGLVLATSGLLNMGVFLKISALFLVRITGMNAHFVGWIMALILALVLVYTLLGGRLSAVYTHYFQFLIFVAAMMLATGFAVLSVGWGNIVATVSQHYGAAGVDPFSRPDMGWAFICLNTLVFLAVPAVWQPSAACALSAKNPRVARRSILWSGLTFMGRGTIPILWGIAALAYFSQRGGLPADMRPIEAMPSFFSQVLPVGVTGLFVAAMIVTDMSTYNGYLLAWSSILSQDVIAPLLSGRLGERALLTTNRVIIVLIGGFLLWWGLLYEPPATFFQYQQVTATIYLSGALVCVGCGLYLRWVNTVGAALAIAVGTVFPLANVLLQPWVDGWPAWTHFLKNGWLASLAAYALAFAAMVIGSLCSAPWTGLGRGAAREPEPGVGRVADRLQLQRGAR